MQHGEMYLTTNLNKVSQIANNDEQCVIIIFGNDIEPEVTFPNIDNVLKASILVPPYEAISLLLDNRMEEFESAYGMYLFSHPDAYLFLQLLLKSLLYGRKIYLVLSKNEAEMKYHYAFCKIMHDSFSLMLQDDNVPFVLSPYGLDIMTNMLYLNNILTVDEYLSFKPSFIPNDNNIIIKLHNDIKPPPGTSVMDIANKIIRQRNGNTISAIPYQYEE